MAGNPIEGQVLVLTAAKASVPPTRLPDLIERAQAVLGPDLERYRREYERLYADDDLEAFLVDWGHWEDLGEELDVTDRELSAIRRAHEEQLVKIGRRTDREDEFETALEIREPVVIGTGDGEESGDSSGDSITSRDEASAGSADGTDLESRE
ncbi:hypothetical protein [Natrinema versiforme]|uniref:DUF8048 domain-containing protein n=1 Tax=Natrinema versiforme JCM 10478 TaxID=1227496 RepID=L9YDD6_9EURY|nr:hypothetical protein [Natrinema versiforme]ELY70928.1 hypothetical protein C489_01181 [Natrinema versiforme JCM 10478]